MFYCRHLASGKDTINHSPPYGGSFLLPSSSGYWYSSIESGCFVILWFCIYTYLRSCFCFIWSTFYCVDFMEYFIILLFFLLPVLSFITCFVVVLVFIRLWIYFNILSLMMLYKLSLFLFSIHPSSCAYPGSPWQQVNPGSPERCFQLLLSDPEAFPGQMGYVIPPESSGTDPGSPSSCTCLENFQRTASKEDPHPTMSVSEAFCPRLLYFAHIWFWFSWFMCFYYE